MKKVSLLVLIALGVSMYSCSPKENDPSPKVISASITINNNHSVSFDIKLISATSADTVYSVVNPGINIVALDKLNLSNGARIYYSDNFNRGYWSIFERCETAPDQVKYNLTYRN